MNTIVIEYGNLSYLLSSHFTDKEVKKGLQEILSKCSSVEALYAKGKISKGEMTVTQDMRTKCRGEYKL